MRSVSYDDVLSNGVLDIRVGMDRVGMDVHALAG